MNLIFILPVYNSENIIYSSLDKLISYLNNILYKDIFFLFLLLMMGVLIKL